MYDICIKNFAFRLFQDFFDNFLTIFVFRFSGDVGQGGLVGHGGRARGQAEQQAEEERRKRRKQIRKEIQGIQVLKHLMSKTTIMMRNIIPVKLKLTSFTFICNRFVRAFFNSELVNDKYLLK